MFRIGVDVGGTNTDAVVMEGDKILAGVKSPTTEDVMGGNVIVAFKAVACPSQHCAEGQARALKATSSLISWYDSPLVKSVTCC